MFGWISDWIGAFFDKLRSLGAGIAGRVLTSLGFGWMSQKFAAPSLSAFLGSHLGGMMSQVVDLLTYINVGKAISLVISAYAARYFLRFVGVVS